MSKQQLKGEKELIERIAEGDKIAFTALFNHYQKFVYTFGKKLTHSDEAAIDMVQDIFLKIWEKRETLNDVENFGAYLNRVVRNHSFNKLRSIASKATIGLEEVESLPEYSTLQDLDYKETVRLVEEALCLLSPQQRTAYELCHQQGLKYQEAAEQMGISSQTLHAHMKLALKKIREHLKKNAILYPLIAIALLR